MDAHVLHLAFGCQPVDSPSLHSPCLLHIVVFLRFLATSLSPILHPRSSSAMICVKKLGMRTWALTLQLKQASCITWLCFSFPFLSFTAVFIQAYWLHPYKSNDFSIRISVRFSLQTSWVLEDKGVLYCWLAGELKAFTAMAFKCISWPGRALAPVQLIHHQDLGRQGIGSQ